MSPEPDREIAAQFLAALTGSPDTKVAWQIFPDVKGRGAPRASHHAWPLDDDSWEHLSWRNRAGCGIFVTVNECDGKGRTASNVIGLRALFIDDDTGDLDPASPRFMACPPSIVVRSKAGCHLYWLLKPGEPLDAFSPAQQQLAAHFGTDPTVSDLPRVLRVPGFIHAKDPAAPFLVQLVQAHPERRYSITEVLAAYPAPAGRRPGVHERPTGTGAATLRRNHSRPQGMHLSAAEVDGVLQQLRGLKVVRWAVANPEDVTREAWRSLAVNIAAAVIDHPAPVQEKGRQLFHEISRPDVARYHPGECDRVFDDALKSAATHGPVTYDHLISVGVPVEVCSGGIAKAPVAVARKLLSHERRRRWAG